MKSKAKWLKVSTKASVTTPAGGSESSIEETTETDAERRQRRKEEAAREALERKEEAAREALERAAAEKERVAAEKLIVVHLNMSQEEFSRFTFNTCLVHSGKYWQFLAHYKIQILYKFWALKS